MTSTTTDHQAAGPPQVSPDATRREMTKLSARGYVTLRNILVQLPDDQANRSSTVGWAMNKRKRRELVLYLLLLTCWPWLQKRDEPLSSDTWLRALKAEGKTALTWSPSSLSRAWGSLERQGLVTRTREGQRMRIEPCREDGKLGDEEGSVPYTAPVGDDDRLEHYFILPDEFWHEELFAKLTLSGVVMLLIIAKETSQKQDAWLTLNRMSAWYGVSQPSAQEGIKQLRDLGYLEARDRWVLAPLAPLGSTNRIYYELSHEFSHEARKLRQTKTRLSREVRLRSVSKRNR